MSILNSLVLLSLFIGVYGNLYGTINEQLNGRTHQWIVDINSTNGESTKIVETFTLISSSVGDNALSAFDNLNNIYYYSYNYPSAIIFRIDTQNKVSLPPIYYTEADSISSMVYDQNSHRLIVSIIYKNTGSIIAIYSDSLIQTLYQIPTTMSLNWSQVLAVNEDNLYFIAKSTVGYTMTILNLSTHSTTQTLPIKCSVIPQYVVFDKTTNTLVGFATTDSGPVMITLWQDGVCNIIKLPYGEDDMIVDGTFDYNNRIIYMNALISTGSQLVVWSLANMKIVNTIYLNDVNTLNLEYGA